MKNVMKWVLGVIMALLIVAIFASGGKESEQAPEPSIEDLNPLRKCAVMEAADIYTTGVGKKSDNVFNDGREACEDLKKQLGDANFGEVVNADWANRKDEQIDGKPLEHYLTILDWQ